MCGCHTVVCEAPVCCAAVTRLPRYLCALSSRLWWNRDDETWSNGERCRRQITCCNLKVWFLLHSLTRWTFFFFFFRWPHQTLRLFVWLALDQIVWHFFSSKTPALVARPHSDCVRKIVNCSVCNNCHFSGIRIFCHWPVLNLHFILDRADGLCTVSDFSGRGNWERKPF